MVVREERNHPQKLNSPVRKWLTYMALVIAAGVFIGDLITALTYLLRGEITSRFLAKAFVVLLLSGGVFYYYYGGLRKTEEPEAHGQRSRDAWMATVSALSVALMAILGFWAIGSPTTQRTLRADAKRIDDLYRLSQQIRMRWNSNRHILPEHLDELPDVAFSDPITRMPYDYHVKEGSQYELCATFSLGSQNRDVRSRPSMWTHPAGHDCFSLNAAESVENPNVFIPN